MHKINKNNYEAFLLDYLEGNLNEPDLENLKTFAVLHPELEIDLTVDPLLRIKKDILNLENKNSLLKTDHDYLLNNIALNYIENNLNVTERINFEFDLKTNSTLQKEVTQFKKTKLTADLFVFYPNKNELKKEVKVISLFNFKIVSAVAAGLLLFVGLGLVLNSYFNSNVKIDYKIVINPKNNTTLPYKLLYDSLIVNNSINNSSQNLIAKNLNNIVKQNKSITTQTHSVNILKTNQVFITSFKNDSINSISSSTNTAIVLNSNLLNLVNINSTIINAVTTQTILLAIEEDTDESIPTQILQKNNFWKRAVKVAKQLNGLGMKAIKGDEKSNNNYVLAFNSVSVEKK